MHILKVCTVHEPAMCDDQVLVEGLHVETENDPTAPEVCKKNIKRAVKVQFCNNKDKCEYQKNVIVEEDE